LIIIITSSLSIAAMGFAMVASWRSMEATAAGKAVEACAVHVTAACCQQVEVDKAAGRLFSEAASL
jgi:hypothetical protein